MQLGKQLGAHQRAAQPVGRRVRCRRVVGPLELDASYERWRNDLGSFSSSPVIAGDRIYQTVLQGDLCCIDAATGEILWKEKLAPDQIHASPVAADGKLYLSSEDGDILVVRASTEYELLATNPMGELLMASPALSDGVMYVRGVSSLFAVGQR